MKPEPKPLKAIGAPRKTNKLPVVESQEQASALTGAPIDLIRAVKKSGACKEAFLSSQRVDLALLVPALFKMLEAESNLPEGVSTAGQWLQLENARIKSIIRAKLDREVIPVKDVVRQAQESGGYFMEQLERFCNELPPALSGCSVIEIAKRMDIEKERVRKHLTELLDKMQ